ncbi:MAG: ABC transporter permease [Kiloniellales bacterium]
MSGGGASLLLAAKWAQRELRGGLKGFRVFLACLLLGVAAIAAVGSLSTALTSGLRADGQRLLGGDLDIRVNHRPLDAEVRAWLEAQARVSQVSDLRSMAKSVTDGARTLIELRAVDRAYPLYGQAILAPAQSLATAFEERDGLQGAAIERRLLGRLGVTVGDTIEIGEARFQVRAVIEKEPDSAVELIGFGPRVLVSEAGLAATGLVQPGSLVHYHNRVALADPRAVPALKAELLERYPDAGWRVRDAREAAPGLQRFLDRLRLYLTLVGLSALLVGGVGVGNAVRSYLEERLATIATLKCLGAPARLIFRVYLIQILALAGLGTLLGLLVGATAPLLVRGFLDRYFGWDLTIGIYPLPLLIAATFGLLTALAFSLLPLAEARAVPAAALFRRLLVPPVVRPERRTLVALGLVGGLLAALVIVSSDHRLIAAAFVLGAILTLVLFRAAASLAMSLARSVPRLRRPAWRLAIANLHRPGAATPSVVLSLGLGLTVLVALALIEGNLKLEVERNLPERAPAFYFIDIQPDQLAEFERQVAATPGARITAKLPMLRGRILALKGTPIAQLDIPSDVAWVFRGDRGITWSREPPEGAKVIAGGWWAPDYSGPPLVSLDAEVAEAMDLEPGDRLTVDVLGRAIEAEIVNLREIDWSTLSMNFVMVFSPGLLESAPQSYIATVEATPEAEGPVERAVTDALANVSAVRVKEALAEAARVLEQVGIALSAIAAVALLAGVLVLAGAVAAGHQRRVYDAVVLKTLGATRLLIAEAMLVEYGLLCLAAALLACLVGGLAAALVLTQVMGLGFGFLPGAAATTLGLAALATLAAALAGTWRALGQKAAPLLRNA